MTREIKRWQEENIRKALGTMRVVVVGGARQVGKTTLSRHIAGKRENYRSLDDTALLAAARLDPRGFVEHQGGLLVIDEVQKAPSLISEVKIAVDDDPRPGQFLLTGSANIQTLPSVTESLAGRVRHIRLRALTQGEIEGVQPRFLEMLFSGDFPSTVPGWNKNAIIDLAFRGGYPETLRIGDPMERAAWQRDYMNALLTRDLADIANIRRHEALRALFLALASWSGKFMDVNAIGAKLAIARATLESYIAALLAMFIFDKVPAWSKSDYDKIGKQPKLFAGDTGLMTAALAWKRAEIPLDADRSGKLIETFVYQELAAQVETTANASLSHYRDRVNREIDFIVENGDGDIAGIEVKAGHHVGADDFKHLNWFRDNLAAQRRFTGLVLYTGEHTLSFGEGNFAVPIGTLWTNSP